MNQSCGLLMFTRTPFAVLLVHPGGPYWRNKDDGAWSIPKGAPESGEDLLAAAEREFREETGLLPHGPYLPLTPLRQRAGKLVHSWAFEGDGDLSSFQSQSFDMEWPPRSGRMQSFPESDQARMFPLHQAASKILASQKPLLAELSTLLREQA